MNLVILGAGTAIPASGYSPSGLYLSAGGQHLVVDAGAGTLQRLHRHGVGFRDLDRMFFTHYHPDHCLDLVSFLFAMRIPDRPRTKALTCYGPRGLHRLYRRLNTAFRGWMAPRHYRLTLTELGPSARRLGRVTVRAERMRHSTTALGYRFEAGGRSVACSGDTDRCAALVRLGRAADVLVLECSMPDERKLVGHLTPTECGELAAAAGCRHLVLTHFYPVFRGYDIRRRVRRAYRGRLTLARDGQRIDV